MTELLIDNLDNDVLPKLFGAFDDHLKFLETSFDVSILNRSNGILIKGEANLVEKCNKVVNNLLHKINKNDNIEKHDVEYLVDLANQGSLDLFSEYDKDVIILSSNSKPIKAKTIGQNSYVESIKKNTLVFGIGPAGTGKTYLAVAMAVKAYKSGQVEKIVLTRPAVEAGEKLGFLPGDLQSKVDPYLRPLYDGLFEFFGINTYQKLMENSVIEICPLAYMRGRTLNNSFIILDEAQNTTKEQMKMFLTRLGAHSKAVITGDITQIDLPDTKKSGIVHAVKILNGVDDISISYFTEKDVVRHKLVKEIIKRYEKYDKENLKTYNYDKSIKSNNNKWTN